MFKKVAIFLMVLILLMVSIPVMADSYDEAGSNPGISSSIGSSISSIDDGTDAAIYRRSFTLTPDGGVLSIGFVQVMFKKNSLGKNFEPVTFEAKIYAENGVPYIEFNPGIPEFVKKVHIRVDKYDGLLYDTAAGKNIAVHINKKHFTVDHFSRYILQ